MGYVLNTNKLYTMAHKKIPHFLFLFSCHAATSLRFSQFGQ